MNEDGRLNMVFSNGVIQKVHQIRDKLEIPCSMFGHDPSSEYLAVTTRTAVLEILEIMIAVTICEMSLALFTIKST